MQVTSKDAQVCIRQIPFNEIRLLAECRMTLILNFLTQFVEALDHDGFSNKIAPIEANLREEIRKGLIQMFGDGLNSRIPYLIDRTMMNLSSFGLALYAASSEIRSSMYH